MSSVGAARQGAETGAEQGRRDQGEVSGGGIAKIAAASAA